MKYLSLLVATSTLVAGCAVRTERTVVEKPVPATTERTVVYDTTPTTTTVYTTR